MFIFYIVLVENFVSYHYFILDNLDTTEVTFRLWYLRILTLKVYYTLGRWLSSEEHCPLLQKNWVPVPAPTRQPPTILTPVPGDLMPSSGLHGYQARTWVHRHTTGKASKHRKQEYRQSTAICFSPLWRQKAPRSWS